MLTLVIPIGPALLHQKISIFLYIGILSSAVYVELIEFIVNFKNISRQLFPIP